MANKNNAAKTSALESFGSSKVHSADSDDVKISPIESRVNFKEQSTDSHGGKAIPGVRRPVFIRVRTAYSIAAT